MLTKLTITNFKRFGRVEIHLGNPVIFIGPNNSGKTTALQALALWDAGLRRWIEKRSGKAPLEKRPGVAINRRDLIAIPVPNANLLFRDLHVRDVKKVAGKPQTKNIRIDVVVDGVTDDRAWSCGLEFDYANEESLYCRPLRRSDTKNPERMPIPDEARDIRVSFLPPMSGLADREFEKQPGEINFLIGQGRTAEVIRNLCHQLAVVNGDDRRWQDIVRRIRELFGVILEKPVRIPERSEIAMTYRDRAEITLDLSSSGRGLQQTLLLLAFLALNARSVLLIDEPDAHLEILRQRQIYQLLTDCAREQGSQIIAASHSEVLLNEAADRDVVVAFVGKPHRIDDRGSQVLKSLKEIGFDQYYQAEQTGWVLYLEGSTDLAILRAFAETLAHEAFGSLDRPFVHYVQNLPHKARDHFYGLREAKTDLVGMVLCDRLSRPPEASPGLVARMWRRREIENYLCQPETLLAFARTYAREHAGGPLFEPSASVGAEQVMQACIDDLIPPVALRDRADPWWINTKISEEFLERLFDAFFKKLGLPNELRKTNFHVLARHVPRELLDPEVAEVLDLILETARRAAPLREEP